MSAVPPSPARSRWRGVAAWPVLLVFALAAAAAAGWWFWPRDAAPPPVNPWTGPVPVRLVAARQEDLTLQLRAIGTVAPLNTVTVRPRVDGPLQRLHFEEGQMVRQGQLLAEIEPSVFRVQLAQAEGQQARNRAELKNAERDLALYQDLYRQDSIARQQLESQQALVEQLRGTQRADQAAVDQARLQLGWTRVEAPIAGRVGLRRVDAGNLVSAADTAGLVTITQTRPIAVLFSVPEHQVAEVRRAHAEGAALVAEAWDRGEQRRLAIGRLATIDNQIDAQTATLRLKAQFDNADESLFPNQFVNVRLAVRRLERAVTIEADAVQHGSAGPYAYVIEDGKARVRKLRLGPTEGGRVVVADGLASGDEVVLEGLDRLREGREVVRVDGSLPPQGAASAAPAPGG